MTIRYQLIPYLYTLFHRVHKSGGTIVRSMAHEFSSLAECLALDEQFLWGSHLLIAPVIYENQFTKWVYLPSSERWFDYYSGEEKTILGATTVSAPLDFIPLFVRGGSIIPHQQSAMNTQASRKKPMYLIVTLDDQLKAEGDLFWDDGESIDTYETEKYNYFTFKFDNARLEIDPLTFNYSIMDIETKLDSIKIYGIREKPNRILWNKNELVQEVTWTYDMDKNVLTMKDLGLKFSENHKFNFNY